MTAKSTIEKSELDEKNSVIDCGVIARTPQVLK